MSEVKLRQAYDVLQAPYIRVNAEIIQNGVTNGKPNIRPGCEYVIAPSAKKIATYIVNQIFGSDLVTQTEGFNINWLMPTLKEALEEGIYQTESFIYIHKFDNKIYLESIKRSNIFDLVQKFDKVTNATIIQDIDNNGDRYVLKRYIKLKDGNTYLNIEAFEVTSRNEEIPININVFNAKTGNNYLPKYILPYEVLINIDLGQDFFKDSKKLLNEEMKIINTIADEVEKTKTRIVTSQHYQSGDIVTNWTPGDTNYKVESIQVGKLQDYFTLLPGDKDHQLFEYLQGNIRIDQYVSAFKFYDYQIIQMAGLSPASFGYEKDAYMNTDNINLSKNASDMTIEAIKSQIEQQINKLLENIIIAQKSEGITINTIPEELKWDYGVNEKFDDIKKMQILNRAQNVMAIPYSIRAKIITPIINKLIDDDFTSKNQDTIQSIIDEYYKEEEKINIKFGEV